MNIYKVCPKNNENSWISPVVLVRLAQFFLCSGDTIVLHVFWYNPLIEKMYHKICIKFCHQNRIMCSNVLENFNVTVEEPANEMLIPFHQTTGLQFNTYFNHQGSMFWRKIKLSLVFADITKSNSRYIVIYEKDFEMASSTFTILFCHWKKYS